MAVEYAFMQGLIKRHDPAWKEAEQRYEQKVSNIIDMTRRDNDQAAYFQYDGMLTPWGSDSWGGW